MGESGACLPLVWAWGAAAGPAAAGARGLFTNTQRLALVWQEGESAGPRGGQAGERGRVSRARGGMQQNQGCGSWAAPGQLSARQPREAPATPFRTPHPPELLLAFPSDAQRLPMLRVMLMAGGLRGRDEVAIGLAKMHRDRIECERTGARLLGARGNHRSAPPGSRSGAPEVGCAGRGGGRPRSQLGEPGGGGAGRTVASMAGEMQPEDAKPSKT